MKRVAFFAGEKQLRDLKALSAATRIKTSDYLREGIDMVLAKYRGEFKKIQKERGRSGGKGPGQA